MSRRLLHASPYSAHDWGSGGHTRLAATRAALSDHWEVDEFYVSDEIGRTLATPAESRWRDPHSRTRDRLKRVQHLLVMRAGMLQSDFFATSSPEVVEHVRTRAAQAEVALVEFGQLAPCAPLPVPSALVIYDVTWAKHEAWIRQLATQDGGRLERWRVTAERDILERLELRHYAGFDHVVVVTDHDAAVLADGYVRQGRAAPPITVSPNGIGWQRYGALAPTGEPGTAAFVGGLDHPPNLSAIDELLRDILPAVGDVLDTLYLAGTGTDQWQRPGLTGLGRVEDIDAVYERASFTVAPITWGSGSRLKILESLAARRPVVAYPAAAEGLEHLAHSDGLLVAGSRREFVEAVRRLAADPEETARRGAAGRADVARHDWRIALQPLLEVLDRLAG